MPYTTTELIFGIAVALEMIAYNLFVLHKCCERKYPVLITLTIVTVFSLVIVAVTTVSTTILGSVFVRNGNGILMLVGWLYLIPCCLIYKGSFRDMVAKILVIWSFTYSVFSVSVAISLLFPQYEFIVVLFIVQTVVYAVTLYPFLHFVVGRFINMLNAIGEDMQRLMIINGSLWFGLAVVGNLLVVYSNDVGHNVLFTILLMMGAMATYFTLFRIVNMQRHAEIMEIAAFTDSLTGLNNRSSLFKDAQKLIDTNLPFILIFADINHLKQLNDTYGHIYGDNYLRLFAQRCEKKLGKDGKMYRISGDEFVCLYTGSTGEQEFVDLLRSSVGQLATDVKYYGCGVGCAFYPNDGESLDRLVGLADKRMYIDKEDNKPEFTK